MFMNIFHGNVIEKKTIFFFITFINLILENNVFTMFLKVHHIDHVMIFFNKLVKNSSKLLYTLNIY